MKDLTPKEIKELNNVHSISASAFAIEYNWVNEFKCGTSTYDAPHSGPIEAVTPEIIDKVYDIVLTDRRVKVRELVKTTGISQYNGTVISILQEQLSMKKLSARWMRLLTVDHKRD